MSLLVSLDSPQYWWQGLKQEASGRALVQGLQVLANLPLQGVVGEPSHWSSRLCCDLCSSWTSGHSSLKNVLRNTGPINLFYLALLRKKPNPKHSVVSGISLNSQFWKQDIPLPLETGNSSDYYIFVLNLSVIYCCPSPLTFCCSVKFSIYFW